MLTAKFEAAPAKSHQAEVEVVTRLRRAATNEPTETITCARHTMAINMINRTGRFSEIGISETSMPSLGMPRAAAAMHPIKLTAAAACIACFRALGDRAMSPQMMSTTPKPSGMSAVGLGLSDADPK